MKATFVIEAGRVDSEGVQVVPEGIDFTETPLVLTENYDDNKPIGPFTLALKDGQLVGEGDIPDQYNGWYPGIGYRALEEAWRLEKRPGGERINIVTKAELCYVSLLSRPNADPAMPPISLA